MKIQCDIFKSDTSGTGKGKFVTYLVDADPSDTVLDVLIQIYHEQDPSLAFRFACGVAKCGECALSVNDIPCMACDKMVEPLMKIEPLNKLPVIKDLAVDRRHIYNQIHRMLPSAADFEDIPAHLQAFTPEDAHSRIENSIRLTNCFECMICQSNCPRYTPSRDGFVGPLGLLMLAQMHENPAQIPIDGAVLEELTTYCLRCGKCAKFCPAKEKPLILGLSLLGCAPKKYIRVLLTKNEGLSIAEQYLL
jgi:succinate dehydrogenase/fumarate reductase iron-sulfur protein